MRGGCPPGGVIGPPVDIDINHIVLSSLKSMFSDQGGHVGDQMSSTGLRWVSASGGGIT